MDLYTYFKIENIMKMEWGIEIGEGTDFKNGQQTLFIIEAE